MKKNLKNLFLVAILIGLVFGLSFNTNAASISKFSVTKRTGTTISMSWKKNVKAVNEAVNCRLCLTGI